MSRFEIKCCVCLYPLKEKSNVCYDLVVKLQYVAPEVKWLEGYRICETCTSQLEVAHKFRNMCLQLDAQRKTASLLPKLEEIYTCFDCGLSYREKEVLEEHIRTHQVSKSPKFDCDICKNKSYSTRKVLKAHQKKCEKGESRPKRTKTFSCEVCGLVKIHAKDITEHCIRDHSMDGKSVKPYVCDECPMRFTSSANFIQHKKYHRGSRTHICSFCGKSYITKSDLTVHERTHFNKRNYKCEFCAKAFNTNKNLRSHILVVHTDPSLWKHTCEACGRKFPLKSGYEQHMKRHAGEKAFVCHICSKSFVSRSELRKHFGFHSTVKPFKCEYCGKAYKEKRVYEIHLKKSHGIGDVNLPIKEKKYVCHVCPNTFFDRQKLERHLRTHSGIKPYACIRCDKKFSDKYYLKQHLKNVHNVDAEDIELKLI